MSRIIGKGEIVNKGELKAHFASYATKGILKPLRTELRKELVSMIQVPISH